MKRLTEVFILLLQWFYKTQCTCPTPYTVQDEVCFFIKEKNSTFCEAWEMCAVEDGRLMLGNEIEVLKSILKFNYYYWTSINDLLKERYKSRECWLQGDGSQFKNIDLWHSDEPTNYNGNEDCVYLHKQKLNDFTCTFKAKIVCVYKKEKRNPLSRQFVKDKNVPFNEGWQKGCYKEFVIGTDMECASKCFSLMDCKSFYFSNKIKLCVLTMYVDSALPSEYKKKGSWSRFFMA